MIKIFIGHTVLQNKYRLSFTKFFLCYFIYLFIFVKAVVYKEYKKITLAKNSILPPKSIKYVIVSYAMFSIKM